MPETIRDHARAAFLHTSGWGDAAVEALPGDASFRRYFRLCSRKGPALLMDAPPDTEDAGTFIDIAHHLRSIGLSTPQIHGADREQGFVLIEDFGDHTFTRLLETGAQERPLYELAIDALAHLHTADPGVAARYPAYDEDVLLREALLFADWYLPTRVNAPTPDLVRKACVDAWQSAIRAMPPYVPTLVLRDYHIDNLMLLENRQGVARCGLLDFQDALMGHPAYDLMSLLEDARRDVSEATAVAMRAHYASLVPANNTDNNEAFEAWYHLLGAQRHAKVAGIFVRLNVRDGKPVYLKHLPRVVRLLDRNLVAPCLGPVKHWFDQYLPDLTADGNKQ